MDSRVELVDVVKGMSILLVAFHHSQLAVLYPDFSSGMGLFRMPLFFFLSGVFFSVSRQPRDYLINKSDALLKPYFFTLLVLLVGATLFSRGANIGEAAGILFGTGHTIRWTPLWFLTHLWCLLICSYVLVRLVALDKRSVMFKVALLLILLLVGVLSLALIKQTTVSVSGREFELVGLPFSFDIVFISMAFLLSGYLLSQQVKNFTPSYPLLAIAIITFAYVAVATQAMVDLNMRIYDQPIFSTLAAVSGIYFMLCVAFYVSKYPLLRRIFSTFGSASLFVLIFHYALVRKAQVMLGYVLSIEEWALLTGVISYAFSVTAPLLIRAMILKIKVLKFFYFPIKRSSFKRKPNNSSLEVAKESS